MKGKTERENANKIYSANKLIRAVVKSSSKLGMNI